MEKIQKIDMERFKDTFRNLLKEFVFDEIIQTELINLILDGHLLEKSNKILNQTKADISSRINSNKFIKRSMEAIMLNKMIESELDKVLTKLKIKDSIKEPLLKEILSKGISAIETSQDLAPVKKRNFKEEINSSEILKKYFTPENEVKSLSKDYIINILEEIEVEDDEDSHESISSSILDQGIEGLKKYEDYFSENQLNSFKEKIEPFLKSINKKVLSKESIINILKQVEVEDDENLYQDISSSIMEKGIDELKKFEDHFTENQLNSFKEKLDPLLKDKCYKSGLNESIKINSSSVKIDEFENNLIQSQQVSLKDLRNYYELIPESAEKIIQELL